MYPKQIIDALKHVRYPGTGQNIIDANMVDDNIRIDGDTVSFSIIFPKKTDPFRQSLIKAAEAAIHTYVDASAIVTITPVFPMPAPKKETEKPLAGVKVIAVSSGKGGVGKSTVATNISIALAKLGYSVGLLDADIFGPSIPTMLHLEDYQPAGIIIDDKQLIEPAQKYGIKVMSIGFFVKSEQATVWRGPMASNALKQLITETYWDDLDYLIIDTPPGTSDIHLTILQTLNVCGAVIVTTPQKVALADARKGVDMYLNDKINVPILGIVENMSWFTPAELPNNRYYIFGHDGAKTLCDSLNLKLLAQIPLVQSVCESSDRGEPVTLDASSPVAQAFFSLASKLTYLAK